MSETLKPRDAESVADRLAEIAGAFIDVSGVMQLEPELAFEELSPGIESLVGYSIDDLTQRPELVGQLINTDDLELWAKVCSAPLGQITSVTLRGRSKDGDPVWAEVRCARYQRSDGSIALYGVAQNVTAREAADHALRIQQERMRLMLENATDVVLDIDPDSRFRWASPSWRRVLGWDPAELVGQPTAQYIHPEDRAATGSARDSPRDGESRVPRFRVRTSDGGYRWMSGVARQVHVDGRFVGWVAGLHDADAEVRAEEALKAQEEHFRLLAEYGSDVVFRASRRGTPQWVSPSVREILGWEPDELIGRDIRTLIHPDDLPRTVEVNDRINAGERGEVECRLRTARGTYRWVALVARPVADATGRIVGRVGSARDIQREVEARRALTRSEQRFRQAMECAPVGMAILDLNRHFVQVNPALCSILGRDERWLLDHSLADVLAPDYEREDRRQREALLSGAIRSVSHETCLMRADGSPVWVEHSLALLLDDDGTPQSFVSQYSDVTAARMGREQLAYLADHDALTRLLSRGALLRAVDRIAAHPPRTGDRLGALFIDVDRFKDVNDTFGHAIGDQLLTEVAQRIMASARTDDLVARLGGDEIVVALPGVHSTADAERVAAKIQARMAEPIRIDGVRIPTTVSIGVAVRTLEDDPETVIQLADKALYRAKRTGRDRTVVYDPAFDG